MSNEKEVRPVQNPDLALIKATPKEELLLKLREWKQEDEASEQERALKSKQALIKRQQRQKALKLVKQEQELYEKEQLFTKTFLRLSKNYLNVDGYRMRELLNSNSDQLKILGDLLARKALPMACLKSAGLVGATLALLTPLCGIIGLPIMHPLAPPIWVALLWLLCATLQIFFAVVIFKMITGYFGSNNSFPEIKYLWRCRQYIQKLRGKDYFPLKAVKKELGC